MMLRLNFLKSKYGCAFMLLSDFAKKNHITRQRSHQYIQEKRIKNAVRMGCRWYIPANTVVKKRRPWAKRYKKLNRYEPIIEKWNQSLINDKSLSLTRSSMYHSIIRHFSPVFISLFLLLSFGCGPNQEDLLRNIENNTKISIENKRKDSLRFANSYLVRRKYEGLEKECFQGLEKECFQGLEKERIADSLKKEGIADSLKKAWAKADSIKDFCTKLNIQKDIPNYKSCISILIKQQLYDSALTKVSELDEKAIKWRGKVVWYTDGTCNVPPSRVNLFEKFNIIDPEDYILKMSQLIEEKKKEKELKILKSSAIKISYEELLRNPQKYKGKTIIKRGKVNQIIDNNIKFASRYVEDWGYTGYTGNDIIVLYYHKAIDTNLIEGDYIEIVGIFSGSYSYTALLGNSITVPVIDPIRICLLH